MSGIHQFQRYSQKEDFVTNNTLLLLSRIYNANPVLLEAVLRTALEDDSIALGPSFSQQVSSGHGTRVDGLVTQKSMKLVVETKRSDWFYAEQIRGHLGAFGEESVKILLLVCPVEVRDEILEEVRPDCEKHRVVCRCLTFDRLVSACTDAIPKYDLELREMIDDFAAFCQDHALLSVNTPIMRVVPCGATFDLNKTHGVYYMPASRGYRPHRFIGLYRHKHVGAVGRVKDIVVGEIVRNEAGECELAVSADPSADAAGRLPVSERSRSRIEEIATESFRKLGWELSDEHRFFVVDEFIETEFIKGTSGGLQGCRYFDLSSVLAAADDLPTNSLADALAGKEWRELTAASD